MHCLPVTLSVPHQLLKIDSGATQALNLGRKALVHVMTIPVIDPPSVLMVVAHGATAWRARSGATYCPSQLRFRYNILGVGTHFRGNDTHVLILVTGLDAVVAPLQHTTCATGSMSHGQRTHRGLAPKLHGRGRFANMLHLIGEDIQIC